MTQKCKDLAAVHCERSIRDRNFAVAENFPQAAYFEHKIVVSLEVFWHDLEVATVNKGLLLIFVAKIDTTKNLLAPSK